MTSDLKQMYHEKYNELSYTNNIDNDLTTRENLEMPTGWSFICLDETISYYTDHFFKEHNKS